LWREGGSQQISEREVTEPREERGTARDQLQVGGRVREKWLEGKKENLSTKKKGRKKED